MNASKPRRRKAQGRLRQFCLYCNAYLGSVAASGKGLDHVSHGVCADCFPKLVAGTGESFADFLDGLPAPVFVVAPDGGIVTANQKGLHLVASDAEAIRGRPGGEVFSCRYAGLPEGCGHTIHCKTCTIRQTVMHTFSTGEPCISVPAYMDLGDRTGVKTIRFLITTEKAGSVVLLRIEDMKESP